MADSKARGKDRGKQLDRPAFAAYLGVDPDSVSRGVRQGRYPAPDGHLSGRPWWWESTVAAFEPPKPGRPRRTGAARDAR